MDIVDNVGGFEIDSGEAYETARHYFVGYAELRVSGPEPPRVHKVAWTFG